MVHDLSANPSIRNNHHHPDIAERLGGALVGIGSLATVGIIALFLSAGGPNLVGATSQSVADVLVASPTALAWVGILSIPANIMVIVGALLLTNRASETRKGALAGGLWNGVAVAFILVMLYDLALPFLLVPLAVERAAHAAVFDGLYATFDFAHSVGLMATFMALSGVFWGESGQRNPRLPVVWTKVASAACLLGVALTATFLAGSPLVLLAPATFVVWLSLGVLGVRIAIHGA